MRTSPVALAHLGDSEAVAAAARAVSELTHHDPVAGDACVLWCLASDLAVRTGRLDVRVGLSYVDSGFWAPLLAEAENVAPAHYAPSNGWVVAALLTAWSSVNRTSDLPSALITAVQGGGATDTVAAITGALAGAAYGGSGVPVRWRRMLHGWPGLRARDLVGLAYLTAHDGYPSPRGWPTGDRLTSYDGADTRTVPHPDDDGVLLGAVGALRPGGTAAGLVDTPSVGLGPAERMSLCPESSRPSSGVTLSASPGAAT